MIYDLYLQVLASLTDRFKIRRCLLKHALSIPLEDAIALDPHQLLTKQRINASPSYFRSEGMPEPIRVNVLNGSLAYTYYLGNQAPGV
ncbi:MAG TPA: hypothetical protein V6C57_29135 [Coleofasciculaceae cyanobacterium]